MEPLRKTLIISTCVTHVCRSRSSWYRISRLLAGWLGGPRSSCHTNGTRWKKPTSSRRPFSWEPPPEMVCWEPTTSQQKIYQLLQRCREKTPEFFQFRFRTFLGKKLKKRHQKQILMIFMSLWVWNRFVFIDEVEGVFHNALKPRGVFPVFFDNQAYPPAMRKHWRPRNSTGGIFGVNRLPSNRCGFLWLVGGCTFFFGFLFVRLTKVWLCWEVWKITVYRSGMSVAIVDKILHHIIEALANQSDIHTHIHKKVSIFSTTKKLIFTPSTFLNMTFFVYNKIQPTHFSQLF